MCQGKSLKGNQIWVTRVLEAYFRDNIYFFPSSVGKPEYLQIFLTVILKQQTKYTALHITLTFVGDFIVSFLKMVVFP